jgi:hypothetical protein
VIDSRPAPACAHTVVRCLQLDDQSGELRRRSERIPLPPQPLRFCSGGKGGFRRRGTRSASKFGEQGHTSSSTKASTSASDKSVRRSMTTPTRLDLSRRFRDEAIGFSCPSPLPPRRRLRRSLGLLSCPFASSETTGHRLPVIQSSGRRHVSLSGLESLVVQSGLVASLRERRRHYVRSDSRLASGVIITSTCFRRETTSACTPSTERRVDALVVVYRSGAGRGHLRSTGRIRAAHRRVAVRTAHRARS